MKKKGFFLALAVIFLCGALVTLCNYGLGDLALKNREKADLELMQTLLPGSETFTPETVPDGDEYIRRVFTSETGYLIEAAEKGYAGEIVLWIGVDNGGSVTGLVVRSLHETRGLGRRALKDVPFLSQFLESTGNLAVGDGVDALTGATVTSKAITRAVNAACAYVTGADVDSSATEWGN